MDLCVTFFYWCTRVKNLLNDLRVSRAPLQCHLESGTTTNTVCTYQIWYSLYEHADTCPFLKVSSTSLLLPLFHHQIFSPSLSSLLLIISKRSPSSCWEQWACMCVNCQYKTALAWAQMKTHSWQGIGEYRLLRCLQMFFFMWRSDYCVWRKSDWAWSTPAKDRLLSTSNNHISGWNQIFENKFFKYILLFIYLSLSLSCTVTLIQSGGHIYLLWDLICEYILLFPINTSRQLSYCRLPNSLSLNLFLSHTFGSLVMNNLTNGDLFNSNIALLNIYQ